MTRRLILMRHAKSSWGDLSLPDHERPLNGRGRKSAEALGAWLRQQDHVPNAALVSNSERTRETFQRLAVDCPVEFTPQLYHADPADILRHLQAADAANLLIIAHNPGISYFATGLMAHTPTHPRFGDYPTGATLVADFDIDTWAQARLKTAALVDFVVPRELTD